MEKDLKPFTFMTIPNHDLNLTSQYEPNAIVDGSLPPLTATRLTVRSNCGKSSFRTPGFRGMKKNASNEGDPPGGLEVTRAAAWNATACRSILGHFLRSKFLGSK